MSDSESRAFTRHEGVVIPLDRNNVDTDQIIPKQFLKSIHKTGFGVNLFDAWRYEDEGVPGVDPASRPLRSSFVLNDPRYSEGSILLARANFGCGSSREHAVWAILQYGIRVVIATSFADIFSNNCITNGLVPITLTEDNVEQLFELTSGTEVLALTVDLEEQTITTNVREPIAFSIDPVRRHRLLNGLDDIGLTLELADQIRNFEERHRASSPWLF